MPTHIGGMTSMNRVDARGLLRDKNAVNVLWSVPNVGPYHEVRFGALASFDNVQLEVAEVASSKNMYPWTRKENPEYQRTTLFQCKSVEDLSQFGITIQFLQHLWRSEATVFVANGYARPWDVVATVCAKVKGLVVLTTFDTTQEDRRRNKYKERAKSIAMRSLFDGVFCSGKKSKEYLEVLDINSEIIQGGYDVVDNSHFSRIRERKNRTLPDSPFFLSVTRFAPVKNLNILLEAYDAYTNNSEKPWPLVMCGSGPSEGEIRGRARKIKSGRVIFPGFVGYDDLPEFYQRSGCMVLPSSSEPWGLVVNESLAASNPVIVSERCGCVADLVVDGENGFVFEHTNCGELADLLQRIALLSEKQRREMGRCGAEIVMNYSPKSWARNFLELVKKAKASKMARGGSR